MVQNQTAPSLLVLCQFLLIGKQFHLSSLPWWHLIFVGIQNGAELNSTISFNPPSVSLSEDAILFLFYPTLLSDVCGDSKWCELLP